MRAAAAIARNGKAVRIVHSEVVILGTGESTHSGVDERTTVEGPAISLIHHKDAKAQVAVLLEVRRKSMAQLTECAQCVSGARWCAKWHDDSKSMVS